MDSNAKIHPMPMPVNVRRSSADDPATASRAGAVFTLTPSVEIPAPVALVIESVAERGRDIEDHLDALGYQVVPSATLEDAQLVAAKRRVALHIIAIDEPDARARQALENLRAMNKTALLILISASPEVAVLATGLRGVPMPSTTEGRHVRELVQILAQRRRRPLDVVEGEHIDHVLADENGNRTRAAAVLRVDRATLRRKLGQR